MRGRVKVERFEDLICWQKARNMTNTVYELTRLRFFGKDFELVRQIRGAATSAMPNISEEFERWTRKEFIRFLDIAKGSAGEVRSQLYATLDQGYVTADQFQAPKSQAKEVSKTIAGLIFDLDTRSATYQARATCSNELFDLSTEFWKPLIS